MEIISSQRNAFRTPKLKKLYYFDMVLSLQFLLCVLVSCENVIKTPLKNLQVNETFLFDKSKLHTYVNLTYDF